MRKEIIAIVVIVSALCVGYILSPSVVDVGLRHESKQWTGDRIHTMVGYTILPGNYIIEGVIVEKHPSSQEISVGNRLYSVDTKTFEGERFYRILPHTIGDTVTYVVVWNGEHLYLKREL